MALAISSCFNGCGIDKFGFSLCEQINLRVVVLHYIFFYIVLVRTTVPCFSVMLITRLLLTTVRF